MAQLNERRLIPYDNSHSSASWPVHARLAMQYVASLPDGAIVVDPNSSMQAIRSDYVEAIAEELHRFVADVVAMAINAGSERDAVMENDNLATALQQELAGWTEKDAGSNAAI